jgi:hypothetical protein
MLFVTYVVASHYSDVRAEFEQQASIDELLADGGLGVPVPCVEATKREMGKENLTHTSLSNQDYCYYPFSKVRKFWPEYSNRPDIDLMQDLYRQAGDFLARGEPLLAALVIASIAMGLPLVVLAFGWAVAGFAGVSRKPD